MEKEFKELLSLVVGNSASQSDIKKIEKAWEFAKLAHSGQLRLNKEPFANHALQTATNLANWGLDVDSIVSGFLHDTVEDGGAERKDI